ncbi:MAG TPA: type III pantothenate kinase [Gammaproteobacteria bacterium]|nr:type III pantothenate kinase [Gammaproteobacteria bacterium]
MILLLDIGNTRFKWAWYSASGLRDPGAVVHRGREPTRVFADWLGEAERPERVVAVCVAGAEVRAALDARLAARGWPAAEYLRPQACAAGVRNGYREPGRLGIDRWAAIVAAYHQGGGPVCVIGCGTAVTLDLVEADGTHRGGLIVPGRALMQAALVGGTAGVVCQPVEPPAEGILGQSTDEAVAAGTETALAGFLRYALAELRERYGAALRVVVTGGDATRLLSHLPGHAVHAPLLVLEGAALLAEKGVR